MSLRDFLVSILGEYTPVSYEVYDVAADTVAHVIPSGLAGVDWLYVGQLVLLALVVFCTLKCLGALICKIF